MARVKIVTEGARITTVKSGNNLTVHNSEQNDYQIMSEEYYTPKRHDGKMKCDHYEICYMWENDLLCRFPNTSQNLFKGVITPAQILKCNATAAFLDDRLLAIIP